MTPNRVTVALEKYGKCIHSSNQAAFTAAVQGASNSCTEEFMTLPVKSPVKTLLLSLFLGGLGIDRFYLGDKKMGFAKLIARIISAQLSSITAIGSLLNFAVSIWLIVDIFLTYKLCKEMNFNSLYSFLCKHPASRDSANTSPARSKNNLNRAMSGEGSGSMPSRGRLSDFADELAATNRSLSEDGKEEMFGAPTALEPEENNAPHSSGYNSLNDMDEDEQSSEPPATNTNRDDGRRAGEDASSGRSTSNPFSW